VITAYLTVISSILEGEDLEVRYSIYEDQNFLRKDTVVLDYQKPAVAGHVALLKMLKILDDYPDQKITVYINDPALNEFIKGTSTTKNKDVLKIGRETRKELNKHSNITVKDIHDDRTLLTRWNEELTLNS
jgi:hypothetical protein